MNDALALVQPSVETAMGSSTDISRESADAVLLGDDILKLVGTFRTARRCRGIIMTNFLGTCAVDGVGVEVAAFGLLNPMQAAFVHLASALAFILNPARWLPRNSKASGCKMPPLGRPAARPWTEVLHATLGVAVCHSTVT